MQSKRWTFTWNNPGDSRPHYDAPQMDYLVYQGEVGAQQTPHIQGYVRFSSRKRLAQVKRILGTEAVHCEIARGTEEDNRNYCTKPETRAWGPIEHGTYQQEEGRQGRRSDLTKACEMIKKGEPLSAVAADCSETFVRYHNGLIKLQATTAPLPPLERTVQVLVLWGPTGTGKTHRALTSHPDAYVACAGRDPWGMYRGQKAVIFDEFDYRRWSIQDMNRYLDKWRCQLDARYNDRYAEWTHVVICTNLDPFQFWPDEPNQNLRQAFFRRISPPFGGHTEVLSRMQRVDIFGEIHPPPPPSPPPTPDPLQSNE